MSNEFGRNLVDSNFLATVACPAAGGTASLGIWDLDRSTGQIPENIGLSLKIAAATGHTAGTLTMSVLHGTASPPTTALGLQSVIAATTAGSAATERYFRLPSDTNRYVRAQVVSSTSDDGDCTGVTATAKLLF